MTRNDVSHTKLFVLLALTTHLVACAEPTTEADSEQEPHDELDSTTQELVNRDVPCGYSEGYPTWSWWGWTNARFGNKDTSGSKILDVTYQAGAGSVRRAEIGSQSCEFPSEPAIERSECSISQQWGGLTLYVTNYGYWDAQADGSKGTYHPCVTSSEGPSLNVITQ